MITGVNLPAAQLQIAMGVPLHRIPDIRDMCVVPPALVYTTLVCAGCVCAALAPLPLQGVCVLRRSHTWTRQVGFRLDIPRVDLIVLRCICRYACLHTPKSVRELYALSSLLSQSFRLLLTHSLSRCDTTTITNKRCVSRYGYARYGTSLIPFDKTTLDATPKAGEIAKPRPIGHVIACRITAENPDEGFKPSSGRVEEINFRTSTDVCVSPLCLLS
jgi:hypothetical protein